MSENQYVYVFSLDQLKIYGIGTELATASEILCGPYAFKNAEDGDVEFSKIDFEPCNVTPDGTSIQYSLSKDNEIFYEWTGVPLVLGEISDTGTYDYIDSSYDSTIVGDKVELEEALVDVEIYFKREALLNKFILPEHRSKIS